MGIGFYFYYRALKKLKSNSLYRDASNKIEIIANNIKKKEYEDIKKKELNILSELSENIKKGSRSLTKDHFNSLENRIQEIQTNVIRISRVVTDPTRLFIFGKNFGGEEGLVYLRGKIESKRLKVSKWVDSRIEIEIENPELLDPQGPFVDIEIITSDGRNIKDDIDSNR